jgi:hypothetical protein
LRKRLTAGRRWRQMMRLVKSSWLLPLSRDAATENANRREACLVKTGLVSLRIR